MNHCIEGAECLDLFGHVAGLSDARQIAGDDCLRSQNGGKRFASSLLVTGMQNYAVPLPSRRCGRAAKPTERTHPAAAPLSGLPQMLEQLFQRGRFIDAGESIQVALSCLARDFGSAMQISNATPHLSAAVVLIVVFLLAVIVFLFLWLLPNEAISG